MKTSIIRPLLEVALVLLVVLSGLRWATGLFSRRTHTYRLTGARQLRLLFWPLLALGAGLSVLPAVALGSRAATGVEWALAGGFVAFTLALGGPALVLHVRYWLLNQHTEVTFQPDKNRLDVTENGQPVPFARRDVLRAERVTCRARRSFWARYDYLRLHLQDGRMVVLTSLLTDLEALTGFLRNVPTERRSATWCWV